MKYLKQILTIVIMLCMSLFAYSQEVDAREVSNVKKRDSVQVSKHSPTVAMLWSIIPGGGQIYNRKYWKVPIIYGLLEGSCYFLVQYASEMMLYRTEFINRRDGHTELLNPSLAQYPDENILSMKQTAQRNMEIFIAATVIIYTLNFIDAMVDAHLYYFDVSDDLSFHWSPSVFSNPINTKPSYGVSIMLNFR